MVERFNSLHEQRFIEFYHTEEEKNTYAIQSLKHILSNIKKMQSVREISPRYQILNKEKAQILSYKKQLELRKIKK